MRALIIFFSDIILIPIVYILAYILKFKLGFLYNVIFESSQGKIYPHAQIEPYLNSIFVVLLIWIVCFVFFRMYRSFSGVFASVDQFIVVVKVVSFINIIILAVSFLFEIIPNSRFVILYSWIISIIVFQLNRLIINSIYCQKKPKENYAVVGSSQAAQRIIEKLESRKEKTLIYSGSFYEEDQEMVVFSIRKIFKKIGGFTDIQTALIKSNITYLYIVTPDFPEDKIDSLVAFCEKNNINVNLHYALTPALAGVAEYSDLLGMPIVSYKKITFSKLNLFSKRFFDCVMSIVLLILTSPILLLSMIWIRVVSKGPIFFKQERVGLDNKEFLMWKLRTMHLNAESKTGPTWVSKSDNRYIFGGKFLRKFSIDELPQLYNVLKNEMSLIGPRPERKFFVDQICSYAPYFDLRHKIKGGLTGWAQIHGRAHLTNKPLEKFHYDLFYIKNWSLVLDFKILIKTVFIIFKAEEAY